MRPNRYRFDPMALIAGAVFVGLAIAYLLRASGTLTVRPEWALAAAAIGVGTAGLAGALWAMLPAREAVPTAPMGRMAFAPTAPHRAEEAEAEPGTAVEERLTPGASIEGEDEQHAVAVVDAEVDAPAESPAGDERPDRDPPTVDPTK
ncbi:hypothetical protein [Embleya sp. NPDC005971]|uniref:hypothetical protein n=1 Tax=Embleya sp. NPDC005971 TaxID=3156724 RepID=UPI0033F7D26B